LFIFLIFKVLWEGLGYFWDFFYCGDILSVESWVVVEMGTVMRMGRNCLVVRGLMK
jgi:hypothetical protein